ncbi:MAG TPA: flagellar basal body P-ring formation chaperone FlgA [Steroidobacteraceae bacterium]|nr:flagellar basal body P-ring formation chaperone FlgA [Steroidobacteraceae bacterium]
MLVACLAASRLAPAAVPSGELQDISQLDTLARSAAVRELPALTAKQRLEVGPLQPRLQLERCENAVKSSVAPGLRIAGRVVIELRCDGRSAWHLYVPVRVVGTSQAVIAARAIVAGTVLTPKDISVEQRDLSSLPPGYLDDPAIAIGLTASRAVSGGAILTNQQLLGTRVVQRGQTVTLIASVDGMSVRMAGRVLSDGLVNQRVRVENLSSGRVVEGIARSEQIVEIVFQ